MKRMSNLSKNFIYFLAYLFSELITPSYSFALGGTYFRSFDRALLPSFIVLLVLLGIMFIYMNFIKKKRPSFESQLLYYISLLPIVFLTTWFVFYEIEMHTTEPRICFVETATSGTKEDLSKLLDQGINPNVTDLAGDTALGSVVIIGDIEKTKLLISRGANVNIRSQLGKTPLMRAASANHPEIIQFLLDHEANMEDKDHRGQTALIYAIMSGDYQSVQILLEYGANVNVDNNIGMTALMYAVALKRNDLIPVLIKKGAKINAQDNNGSTALHYAVCRGFPETAKLLIREGADVNIKDNRGCTAKAISTNCNNAEMKEIFSEGHQRRIAN